MAAGVTVAEPLYTRDILRLASAVPGRTDFAELGAVSELRSRTCGSRIRVAVTLDEAGRVAALSQAVEACAFGQAAAALMGADAIGMDRAAAAARLAALESWLDGDDAPLIDWPALAALDPARSRTGRHEAIRLPFRALVAAIDGAAAC